VRLVDLRGRAGRIMAYLGVYPRAYRRVRACVFRRMPTQGGCPDHGVPRRSSPCLPRGERLRGLRPRGHAIAANVGLEPHRHPGGCIRQTGSLPDDTVTLMNPWRSCPPLTSEGMFVLASCVASASHRTVWVAGAVPICKYPGLGRFCPCFGGFCPCFGGFCPCFGGFCPCFGRFWQAYPRF
jgi:hypothetical protein